ncbi:hypothetical protein GYH30_015891 [Glycine max]|uniref:Uncharacterized protein n=1 Tax=Glycine max TaxID=3847 RepID=K7KWK0_SOYBN|nr:hypothetical protein GYH30_015891 [Glycine max]
MTIIGRAMMKICNYGSLEIKGIMLLIDDDFEMYWNTNSAMHAGRLKNPNDRVYHYCKLDYYKLTLY